MLLAQSPFAGLPPMSFAAAQRASPRVLLANRPGTRQAGQGVGCDGTTRLRSGTCSPVRLIFALAMMFPLPSGFSSGQGAVMRVAMWGIGMGRAVYDNAIKAVGPDAVPISEPMIPGTKAIVAGLMQNELCRALVNAASGNSSLAGVGACRRSPGPKQQRAGQDRRLRYPRHEAAPQNPARRRQLEWLSPPLMARAASLLVVPQHCSGATRRPRRVPMASTCDQEPCGQAL